MKKLIKNVLADVAIGQPNLASEACQETIATLIIASINFFHSRTKLCSIFVVL